MEIHILFNVLVRKMPSYSTSTWKFFLKINFPLTSIGLRNLHKIKSADISSISSFGGYTKYVFLPSFLLINCTSYVLFTCWSRLYVLHNPLQFVDNVQVLTYCQFCRFWILSNCRIFLSSNLYSLNGSLTPVFEKSITVYEVATLTQCFYSYSWYCISHFSSYLAGIISIWLAGI